jgi:3-methyl-2-oxobutanoate hydroxymethyltransferase
MSVQKFIQMKGKQKIAMLTAYDFLTARVLGDSGIDIILVGDSLGMVFQGRRSTLPVTLDELIYHVKAVRKGAPETFLIADLPFLSYGVTIEDSVRNAGRVMKETGANAVKLEGGKGLADTIKAMVTIGIPVMGHVGLKPQSVNIDGMKIAGKTATDTDKLLDDAKAVEQAGAFALVLEGTTDEAAKAVTQAISIPTIGIGAGKNTDGQVLVVTDMLGMDKAVDFKHNKKFANLYKVMKKAFHSYIEEVRSGNFPTEEQTFHQSK